MRYLFFGIMAAVLLIGCNSPTNTIEPKIYDGVILDVDYWFDNWHQDSQIWETLLVDVTIYQAQSCNISLWHDDEVEFWIWEPFESEQQGENTIYHFATIGPESFSPNDSGWTIKITSTGLKGSYDNREINLVVSPQQI